MAEKTILFCFLLKGVCCREFRVSLPEKIEAFSGSCVIINCTFDVQDKYDNDLITERATGGWYKDGEMNEHQVFNSSHHKQSHFNGNITGKLHEKNCTTIFYDVSSNHNGKYYFRIVSGALKYTYTQPFSTINVNESPPKPRVQLYVDEKERRDQDEVLEGSSVSLRCSSETLCSSTPPTLTWSSTPRIPLSKSSRLQELISDLNFTVTHREQGITFTCTITYQLQDNNKTAQDSITLHVQYAPKISNSSCSSRTDVTVCLCEAYGNPSPELEWHLSGRPVTNSSNTFISEERLSSTGLRSSITLYQSLTHTSILQCVSRNNRGNTSQLLQLHTSVERNHWWFSDHFSVLIGVAVLALVVVLLCFITRVRKGKVLKTTQAAKRSNQNTNEVVAQENQDDSVYAVMSPANQDDIIYSNMDITKSKTQEVGSISSLAVYAVVQDCSGGLSKTESSIEESSRARQAQVTVSANVQTKQTKQSEKYLFEDSSQLYAKVTRRNH